MTKYRVFGEVIIEICKDECICDDICLVTSPNGEIIRQITIDIIDASSVDEAIELAKIEAEADMPGFVRWQNKPQVIPYAVHERPPLSVVGERELLRRWQTGAGLPGEMMR